jgi:two-component system chemotaxis sensor kinase CheA
MSERDRSAAEFLSEAQELTEAFSRDLLAFDARADGVKVDPERLNATFRGIHTLKGLAALFGVAPVAELSHALETTLDGLRLGRIPLTSDVLDVLFEAVEGFQVMLAELSESGEIACDPRPIIAAIDSLIRVPDLSRPLPELGLDPAVLSVITEYEEHRLRENLKAGRRLFRVHASFDLSSIDIGLEELKTKLKSFGEVITYLPSVDSESDERIELDILVGSTASLAELSSALERDGATVHDMTPAYGVQSTTPKAAGGTVGVDREPPAKVATPQTEPTSTAKAELAELAEPNVELSLRSVSQTVRVDLSRLDALMNLIGELGVVHTNLGDVLDHLRRRGAATDVARELQSELRTMQRKLALLQQGVLDVRMVPLGQVFDKLARVVRKIGREASKSIRLSIAGAETELDKLIVEELGDPLMHLVRNCIDHGIESETERVAAHKPATGTIWLRAYQKGNRAVIEVRDDGRGIDWRYVRQAAIRRRVVSEADARDLNPQEIIELIFVPGFSTREEATHVSGRGMGMDIVKTNISRLSGMIDIETVVGKGTRFSITLPITLAIIQALVVETAGQTFCIPLNSVIESVMIQSSEIHTVEGFEVVSLRDRTLPLLHLGKIFALREGNHYRDPDRIYVVIIGAAQHRVGLVVDDLRGQQDVVIKPMGSALRRVPGIAGATELGANRTVLLLDVAALVAEAMVRTEIVGRAV